MDEPAIFADDAWVFRGGQFEGRFCLRNARDIHEELGIWALSTGCDPTLDIMEVARRSGYDGNLVMIAAIGKVRLAGYDVIPDRVSPGDVHSLLTLPRVPADENDSMWVELRDLFDGPITIDREA